MTIVATMAWTIVGPLLVLVAVVACAVAVTLTTRGRTRPAAAIAVLALVALTWSATIVTTIVVATVRAGGSVNPLTEIVPRGPSAEPDVTRTYATENGQALHALIFRPKGSAEAPVLYYIHGGGWVAGSAAEYGSLMRSYADEGWLVVAVDYSLATTNHATWNQAPAQVACGLTWTASNVDRWGGNSTKITVVGDSAGGNLAVNLGWAAANRQAVSSCPDAGSVPIPSAVVVSYPVVNPGYSYDHGAEWLAPPGPKSFTRDYLGGSPAQHPDRLRAISAPTYISNRVPPTLVVEPKRDDFIPAQGVYDVVDQAKRAGADVTLVKIPFAHHLFNAVPGTLGADAHTSIMKHFLAKRGLASL